ncbi:MAG: hypothetical protein AABX84_01205 [Nanoarchaeota archaeon]
METILKDEAKKKKEILIWKQLEVSSDFISEQLYNLYFGIQHVQKHVRHMQDHLLYLKIEREKKHEQEKKHDCL